MSGRCLSKTLQSYHPFSTPSIKYSLSPSRPIHGSQHRRAPTLETSSGRTLAINPHTPCSECESHHQVTSDLDIDRSRPLTNTVAPHNQHVVIATGRSDWATRIETEDEGRNLAKTLKDMTKRIGGRDDSPPITMISNSSFPPPISQQDHNRAIESHDPKSTSLLLFPHFLRLPQVLNTKSHLDHLADTYLGSTPNLDTPSPPPDRFLQPRPITKPVILICSHNSRDRRCGIFGPLLHHEFLQQSLKKPVELEVGMISHIGGHAFAGNVIVYVPPGYCLEDSVGGGDCGRISPLAGMGIWYGRVEPKHVQGIVEETVRKGQILGELWRGGLDARKSNGGDWRERVVGAGILRI